MNALIKKLFEPIKKPGFMAFFLGSIPILSGILIAFVYSQKILATDFVLIAWDPGRELLATGSVSLNYPYPLWTVVVMLPFVAGTLQTGIFLWLSLNVLMLAASLALIFLSIDIEFSPFLFTAAVIISGFFLPLLTSFYLGQLSIFSLFSLALTTYLFLKQRWTWLGIVIGLSFIKPQVMILLAFLILLWALLHRRWQTLLGFGGAIAFLTLISLPFISSPGQLIGGGISSHLVTYVRSTSTLWGLFVNLGISLFVAVIISIALLVWMGIIWRPFLWGTTQDHDRVLFLFSAATLVNLIAIPYSWMHNLILMLLPMGYCAALILKLNRKVRYYWLALLLVVTHPLMLGLFILFNGPTHGQAYEIIPALVLLPAMCFLEFHGNRSHTPAGISSPLPLKI